MHYRTVGPNKFMAKPSPIWARPDSPLSIFLARSWSPQRPWWPDAEKTDVERFGTSPCVVRGVLSGDQRLVQDISGETCGFQT